MFCHKDTKKYKGKYLLTGLVAKKEVINEEGDYEA